VEAGAATAAVVVEAEVGAVVAEGATRVESTPTEVAQMPKKPAKKDAKKPKSK